MRNAIIVSLLAAAGCSTVEHDIREIMKHSGSAKGSELATLVCGWPTTAKIEPVRISVELTPMSSYSDGSGTADISAKGAGFSCGGKIFFTYSKSYSGGHGVSGESYRALGLMKRETPVDPAVSASERAKKIIMGERVSSAITGSSSRLPDGNLAEFFTLDIIKENTAIIVKIERSSPGFIPKGCIYQDGMMFETFDMTGTRVKPGRVFILITDGKKTGEFSITVNELSEKEKAGLK